MSVVQPPTKPFDAFRGPWEPIEAQLKTSLPQDYKEFVALYGLGYFTEFLGVYVPRSRNPNIRLELQVKLVCDAVRGMEDQPYPFWPDAGGLIPFGSTDNGDYLLWLPRGAPDDWPVVVWDRGFGEYEVFECNLTGFLAGLATGDIAPRGLPEDLADCEHLFQPNLATPPTYVAEIRLRWSLGGYGGLRGSSVCRLRGVS